MKAKIILIPLVAAAAFGGLNFACSKSSKKEEPEKAVPAESSGGRSAAGENTVVMDGETQKRTGLATEILVSTNFIREPKGYGRVLDPTPLAALASELASAQLAATGSRQELARLKILKENASEKALQLAETSFNRDQLAVQTAQAKLKLSWGKTIAAQENLLEFLKPIVAGQKILVRIILPAGEILPARPTGVILTSLASAEPLNAEFLEAAPQMDEQTQGQGFLFLAASRADFPPGAAVTGFVQTDGEPLRGVIVPRPAIVRHEGKTWVYLKTAADHFVRREINLKIPTEGGWFVSNFATNQTVVVSGAQTLLSDESKTQN